MRTRIKDDRGNSYQRNSDYSPTGVLTGTTLYTSASKSDGSRDAITDQPMQNFAVRFGRGEIMMNPVTISHDRRECNETVYTFGPHPSWGTRIIQGKLACQWSIPATRPAWFDTRVEMAKSRTLVKAHAKIEKEDFQGLVTFAEAKKTVSMLRSPFATSLGLITQIERRTLELVKDRSLAKDLARDLRRDGLPSTVQELKKRRRTVKDLRADATDLHKAFDAAWLEGRFGWRPTLREISQAIETLVKATDAHDAWLRPLRKVVRASEDVVWSPGHGDVPELYDSPIQPGLTHTVKMARFSEHVTKVASGVLYEIYDENWGYAARKQWGLTLSAVPAAAWELVPLSFVADRFALIGDWIESMNPKPGVRILGSWTTTVEKQFNRHDILEAKIAVATVPATTYTQRGGRYREDIQVITRKVNPLLPILPPLNGRALNLAQNLDHLALITQRLYGFLALRKL